MAYGDWPDSGFDSCSLIDVIVSKPARQRPVRAALLATAFFCSI